MARPLQKKKNKSSLHRVRQKPPSKRTNIKSNPIVAANWDQSQTLSQNYHRLGLSSKLNAHTGGTEYKIRNADSKSRLGALAIPSSKAPKSLGNEEVNVVRDPETGAIISVQHSAAERRADRNPLDDPLNDLSDEVREEVEGVEGDGVGGCRGIVPDLEASAKLEKRKRPRMQSERERDWCRRLVDRWGDDWGGMVRDRKLNPMQQSEGDLRRRIGLWKSNASGVGGGRG